MKNKSEKKQTKQNTEERETNKTKVLFFAILIGIISVVLTVTTNAADIGTQIIELRGHAKTVAPFEGTKDSSAVLASSTSGIKKGQSIPKEYTNFALGFNSSSIQTTTNGLITVPQNVKNGWFIGGADYLEDPGNNAYLSLLESSSINNLSVTYKGVDVYNGQLIDVKATVVAYEPGVDEVFINNRKPMIAIYKDHMGFTEYGLKYITIKYEFYKSGTNETISVKGNTTHWDVDAQQGVILPGYKDLYITNNNILKAGTIDNKMYIYDTTGEDTNNNVHDTKYAITETFSGTNLTITYTDFWAVDGKKNPASVVDYFGLSSNPVSNPETPTITKSVSKNKVSVGEEFTYSLSQKVPAQLPEHYYSSFTIQDTFENCISINKGNIKIYNEQNATVTDKFNISLSGQVLTITPKNLTSSDLYGHTYRISIPASIKAGADLTNYKNGNTYKIPNKATTITNKGSVISNEVIVDVTVPVKVRYNIVTTDNPPTNTINIGKDKPDDASTSEFATYTAEGTLTSSWKKKKCSFTGWAKETTLTNIFTEGQITHDMLTKDSSENLVFNLYGGWQCENLVREPKKAVNDEKNIEIEANEKFNFAITHEVPNIEDSYYYYDKYVFKDKIESVLKIGSVSVLNRSGQDVTNKFKIEIDNSLVTITAKNIQSADFYNQKYTFIIEANKKEDADLSGYYNATTKEYIIPNKATIEVNDAEQDKTVMTTNEVYVKVKQYDIKYHIIGDTQPDPNYTSKLPDDKRVYSGYAYTQENKLTTTDPNKVCKFNGWYLDEAFTTKWTDNDRVNSNLDFYGSWTCNEVVNDINKTVADKYIRGTKEFNYTIYQIVPDLAPEAYYQSYTITDELEEILEIKDTSKVKVFSGKTDVTSKFNIKIEENKITIAAKNTSEADFYNKEYAFVLTVNKKKDGDLSKYLKDGKYLIPNKAKLTVVKANGEPEEKESEEVIVELKKAKVTYEVVGTDKPDPNLTDPIPPVATVLTGEKYTAEPTLTTKDKARICTFNGWYNEDTLESKFIDGTEIEDDITLYGKWDCKDPEIIVNVPKTSASARKLIIGGTTVLALAGLGYYFVFKKDSKVKNTK